MKKILKIENGRGLFLNEEGEYSVITELSHKQLRELLELVFNEKNSDFDLYDDNLVHNAADKIIYSKVVAKLKNIKDHHDEIVHTVTSGFSDLKSKYRLDD